MRLGYLDGMFPCVRDAAVIRKAHPSDH